MDSLGRTGANIADAKQPEPAGFEPAPGALEASKRDEQAWVIGGAAQVDRSRAADDEIRGRHNALHAAVVGERPTRR